MASNIPLGTFLEDGVRVGPLYSGQIPSKLLPFNPTLDLSYSAYSSYGPGILQSAQNTWNITPAPTSVNNVVAPTNVAPANNLTLTGDNVATRLISASNFATYTQFDWPRVPEVTISEADLAAPLRVTIFGFDFYGNPMQHTYVVQNRGTYPTVFINGLSVPSKAFYSVTKVTLSAPLTNGAFISVGAGDIFGLPFLLNDAGDITSIGWGVTSDLQDNSSTLSGPITGVATLVGGTVTVDVNAVQTTSSIMVTRNTPSGGLGELSVPSADVVENSSFVINSSDDTDTSTVNWSVINPLAKYSAAGITEAMVAGVVNINTSQVTPGSNIQLTLNEFGTAHGQWYVSNVEAGQQFTVTSTDNTETSTVSWAIMPSSWVQGVSNPIGSAIAPVVPVAGEVFVDAPTVKTNSNILLTYASNPGVNGGVLSAPTGSIIPGVGFTIVSSNTDDTASVSWAITSLEVGSSGTSTLVGGTVTVDITGIAANSVILLSDNTLDTPSPYISATIDAGVSFTITAEAGTDDSSINWAIFPANFYLPTYVSPLGTFVPADQINPPSAITGDVRGLYAPSSPSDGIKSLRFTAYVEGADQWINQASNNQFVEKSLDQPVVGITINPLTPKDLYGFPQFYTGKNS